MSIGLIRWDDTRIHEGHTLGRADDDYARLIFTGPETEKAEIQADLLAYAGKKGYQLAEGFLVEPDRSRRRVSVSAIVLNADGTPRARRIGGSWYAAEKVLD